MKRQMLFMISMLIIFSGCVPLRGDYSEFSSRAAGNGEVVYITKPMTFAQGTYQGGLLRGFPHEKGTFRFWNGTVYEGEFRNGKFHGKGRMALADSSIVEGSFVDDRENDVTLTRPDGSVFSGQVSRGKPAGKGVLRLADRSSIVGNFTPAGATGTGLLLDAQGRPSYAGPFNGTIPSGEGVCAQGICTMEQGRDVTQTSRAKTARQNAQDKVNNEVDSELANENKKHAETMEQIDNQQNAAESKLAGYAGPKDGEPCYCYVVRPCIYLEIAENVEAPRDLSDSERRAWWKRHYAREEEAKRIAELRKEQERMQCRHQYADYLGIREDPDYQQKLAQIKSEVQSSVAKLETAKRQEAARHEQHKRSVEAQRQKRLADAAEMRRLAAEAAAKLEREAKEKMERLKASCSDPKVRRANPCRCSVALDEPPRDPKSQGGTGACEA